MKMNLRTFTWLSLAALTFGLAACERTGAIPAIPCSKLDDTAAPHPDAVQYQALLQKYIRLGLPGIAVRVEDGRGIYTGAAGLADIRGGINFTPCTVSKLGSVTKPFLATSVFRLAEQGLLDLDAPVAAHFTADQRKRVANLEQVSLRDLLMHHTGIPDLIVQSNYYLDVLNRPDGKRSAEDLLKFVYDLPADFVPRSRAVYSNTNTLLVSMVVDAIRPGGHDHGWWMRKLVFEPVGMGNTWYRGYESVPGRVAKGYFDLYQNGALTDVTGLVTGDGHGFTGAFSNVYDLHRFLRALFVDSTLLNAASLQQMQTWQTVDAEHQLGAGLIHDYFDKPIPGVGHFGGDFGYAAGAHIFPGASHPQRGPRSISFCVNYGTNGGSALRDVYLQFRNELYTLVMRP